MPVTPKTLYWDAEQDITLSQDHSGYSASSQGSWCPGIGNGHLDISSNEYTAGKECLTLDFIHERLAENAKDALFGQNLRISNIATYQPFDGMTELKMSRQGSKIVTHCIVSWTLQQRKIYILACSSYGKEEFVSMAELLINLEGSDRT